MEEPVDLTINKLKTKMDSITIAEAIAKGYAIVCTYPRSTSGRENKKRWVIVYGIMRYVGSAEIQTAKRRHNPKRRCKSGDLAFQVWEPGNKVRTLLLAEFEASAHILACTYRRDLLSSAKDYFIGRDAPGGFSYVWVLGDDKNPARLLSLNKLFHRSIKAM